MYNTESYGKRCNPLRWRQDMETSMYLTLCEMNALFIDGFPSNTINNKNHVCVFSVILKNLLNEHLSWMWFVRSWRSCDVTVKVLIDFNLMHCVCWRKLLCNHLYIKSIDFQIHPDDIMPWKRFPHCRSFARGIHCIKGRTVWLWCFLFLLAWTND